MAPSFGPLGLGGGGGGGGGARVDFSAPGQRQVVHFWPGGSQGPPRARGLVKEKNDRGAVGTGSDTPWAVGPANF